MIRTLTKIASIGAMTGIVVGSQFKPRQFTRNAAETPPPPSIINSFMQRFPGELTPSERMYAEKNMKEFLDRWPFMSDEQSKRFIMLSGRSGTIKSIYNTLNIVKTTAISVRHIDSILDEFEIQADKDAKEWEAHEKVTDASPWCL